MQMGGAQVERIDDLLQVMDRHLARFEQAGDHRAGFLRVYRTMTAGARERLRLPFFLDPGWVERVAVRFAWYYFDAMERFDQGRQPPPAWERAFTAAREQNLFLLQDVLLGMNAHINNDLPLVIAAILRDEQDLEPPLRLIRRRFDHDQINRVLHEVIPTVEAELAQHGGRLLGTLGWAMGTLDQTLATLGLKTWRDKVWSHALFLLSAQDKTEEALVIGFIEQDALRIADQIERLPVLRHWRPLAPLLRRLRLG